MNGIMRLLGLLIASFTTIALAQDVKPKREMNEASVVKIGDIAPPRVAQPCQLTPEEALKATAVDFEEITLRFGREQQRRSYRTSLGL